MSLANLSQRQKGLLAACTTAASWSLLALFLKVALKYADSYTIVWYRMLVAFFGLVFWFAWKNELHKLKILVTRPGLLLVASVCLGFNYLGFMQGVHYAGPATAQIFIQLGPLMLALSGIFVFKENLSRSQAMGLIGCVFGFGLFFWDRMDLPGDKVAFYTGATWVLMAAVTWAIFTSLLKVLMRKWSSAEINTYVYLIVTLMYLPVVNWDSLTTSPYTIHFLYILLGLNTLLAYGCLSIALKYLPATQVSPIITMNPLLTLVLITLIDFMEWNFIPADPIGWKGYLGAIIALFGIRFVLNKEKSET